MLTSLHPTSPTPDQAVRDLLDQRARASHTRYPSVSYSQRSDSPSIYSRGDFSPNIQTHFRGSQWPHSGYQTSLAGQGRSSYEDDDEDEDDDAVTTFTRTSFDQDDQSLFPPADDDISVISPLTPRPPVHPGPESSAACDLDTVSESPPTEAIEEDPRMSMLGPKMRFVSKAPWELGEDDMLEEEEEEPSSATDALSVFSTKMSNWRNKDQDKSSAKGLGLTTIRSRSPGSLPASSRKGSGGMGSGLYRHQNHESQREGPYGPHLSGASQSHGAIPSTLASSSRSSHSVTDSLSSDHVAHRQPHGRPSAASLVDPFPFPTHPFRPQNMSYSSHGGSNTSFHSESPPPSDRYVHPYANPELLPTVPSVPSVPHPRTPRVSQDRMSDEKEQPVTPLRRASESATTSPPRGTGFRKASAGALPLPAMPSRHAFGEHRESDELSHLAFRPPARTTSKPVPSSPARTMLPYGDQPGSPMHSLITLEQARARMQSTPNRGQGLNGVDGPGAGAASTTGSTPSSTLVAGIGLAPGIVVDSSIVRGQMQHANPPSVPPSDDSSWQGMPEQKQIAHPRPRTASSGKNMFGNGSSAGADGDAIPAKTLKHKKSAFMKLFQGKDKERERDNKDTSSFPSDFPIRAMSTPPQVPPPSDSPVPPLPSSSLHNIKRIPPPLPLSVFVTSPSFPSSGSSPQPDQEGSSARPPSPARLRQASAPLPASSHGSSYLSTEGERLTTSESQPPSTSGPESSKLATSAPAVHTTFETLSLRPVSTIFSAKFPDLLSHSSLPDTTSSATLKLPDYPSPTTPGFSDSRSTSLSTTSDFPLTPTSGYIAGPSHGVMSGEDQSTIITSLQEQIVNSRKMWQRQIWELEGQVKDLKAEVEELRNTGECETCGMAKGERRARAPVQNVGVVDRPRPRLGGGNTRTVFGGGCDM